jgi:hypothetical protein
MIDLIKGRGGWARKVHGSGYSSGEPDIDAVMFGRSCKVEVKMPGKEPTAQQMARLRRWEDHGALAGWTTSVEELGVLLDHWDDKQWKNPQLEREEDA